MTPTLNITFLDPLHQRIEQAVREHLPLGWVPQFAKDRSLDVQRAAIATAEIAFLIGMPLPRELLLAATQLRFVQKLGIGVDKIDLTTCADQGIAVAKVSGGNATPVAEHTVLLMLATLRRLPLIDRRTRAGEWQKEESRGIHRQISGRRVGIIGFGAIGQNVAQLLKGFNADVLFFDPMPVPAAVSDQLNATSTELDQLIESSDIVSLHLPLLDGTRNIISRQRIASMKPGAIIINCARGGLIDEVALLDALQSGHLMGAGLDVFEQEPPLGNALLNCDATVVTPHLAGATFDNFLNVLTRGIDNAQRFLDGRNVSPADLVIDGKYSKK